MGPALSSWKECSMTYAQEPTVLPRIEQFKTFSQYHETVVADRNKDALC
jgi:hypothetical protein